MLKNHNVIITGGTSGLGLVIARAFVENGASVSICGINMPKLKSTQSSLRKLAKDGQKVFAYRADVSNEEEVQREPSLNCPL